MGGYDEEAAGAFELDEAPKGVGAFDDIGGYPPAAAFGDPNGVGALVDMGGYDEEAAGAFEPNDALKGVGAFDDIGGYPPAATFGCGDPNGVGALVDMGGYDEEAAGAFVAEGTRCIPEKAFGAFVTADGLEAVDAPKCVGAIDDIGG
jgi:hypothetical protein